MRVIKIIGVCLGILAVCAVLLYVIQRWYSPISFEFRPHTSVRSYTLSGTILDEDTHAPIAGAKIFLTAHPEVRCESDFAGTFTLREIRQWHAGYMCVAAGASHWPHNDYWEPRITVSHTNYVLREINWEYRTTDVISLNKQTLVR